MIFSNSLGLIVVHSIRRWLKFEYFFLNFNDGILTDRILDLQRTPRQRGTPRPHLSLTEKFEIVQFRDLPENQNISVRQFAKKAAAYFDRKLALNTIQRILHEKDKIRKALSICDSSNLDPSVISANECFYIKRICE